MISDDDVEKAIEWLRDQAKPAARAKAEQVYMDEYRKVVKAQLMRERPDSDSLGAREQFAYSDPRYKAHLEVLRDAEDKNEYFRWMRVAAEAKIEAWRTQQSNQRALGTFK